MQGLQPNQCAHTKLMLQRPTLQRKVPQPVSTNNAVVFGNYFTCDYWLCWFSSDGGGAANKTIFYVILGIRMTNIKYSQIAIPSMLKHMVTPRVKSASEGFDFLSALI